MDMMDLFSARGDRDFDRMTGLTSAESAVGFDDDDDDDEEEEEEDSSEDEDREGKRRRRMTMRRMISCFLGIGRGLC